LVSVTNPNVADLHLVENPPKYSLAPLLVDDTAEIILTGTPIWQRQSTSTLHLLRLVEFETAKEEYNLIMYSLRDVAKLNDPFLPKLLPVSAGRSWFVHEDDNPAMVRGPVSSLLKCDNHLVFCTGNELDGQGDIHRIIAVALQIPSQFSDNTIHRHSMTLLHRKEGTGDEDVDFQFGFCPMSGRLVYLSADGIEPEVRLADYLLPPEEPSRQEYS
jgi:hypothetical protein